MLVNKIIIPKTHAIPIFLSRILIFVKKIAGNSRFSANIKELLGRLPQRWWRICWMFISPSIIAVSKAAVSSLLCSTDIL